MKEFLIDHIDPLGQGVFKEDGLIYFIPKTLPGESGLCEVIKSHKGVNFARLVRLDNKSEIRITPNCLHFKDCSGCHYLHTSYENEIKFKTASYKKQLKQIGSEEADIKTISSPTRLHYRNRVQLHYNYKQKRIGYKSTKSHYIVAVPECKIMDPLVEKAYLELLGSWYQTAKKSKKKTGHIEIYNSPSGVQVNWNAPYAEGGFTQVNQLVNLELQKYVSQHYIQPDSSVLDLFAGTGNFSKARTNRVCIDIYKAPLVDKNFMSLNLFDENALKTFKASSFGERSFNILIVDPPRSGFSYLSQWSQEIRPQYILYISCHCATMTRDLKEILPYYNIKNITLIDLFPSTFHFEAMIFLEKACS